ncbi:DHS-like NAD/FAD-binding domain-containing protein [Ascobolus immersus RN42]|uniref:DHS-like NAD/FAD-binding domain-containing protein n=1 Tax=Ascobolus immersus RN42 TaxID=1160509 RepID=A0A3N4HNF2_ASCIM|nr:DHS-like NAD/FAD-binding domain-containing protein [Ascobolus immersus RN42]
MPGPLRIPFPNAFPSPASPTPPHLTTLPSAISAITDFLLASPPGKTTILTGAGISTASGLTDYRGPQGTYSTRTNFRPVLITEFLNEPAKRNRYWSRAFLGYDSFSSKQPSPAHRVVAELVKVGLVGGVVTQNVDSLHERAMVREGEEMRLHWREKLVELHGALREVRCVKCEELYEGGRAKLQEWLASQNPVWEELRVKGDLIQGPDGDVAVPEGVRLPGFVEPGRCGGCGGLVKPDIVFFGENLRREVKERAEGLVGGCERLLVLGTSLATLSAWRLVKRVVERRGEVAMVTLGGARDEQVFFGEGRGVRVEFDIQDVMVGVEGELRNKGIL